MTLACITLNDPATGASARVLAGYGFNCFEFQVPHASRQLNVLWAEEDFESGRQRASGSGIPILFPFPGRIPGTEFRWEGKSYQLEAGDGRGNAIHGFVLNRPWRILDQAEGRVSGQFQASLDDPQLLERWPADFRITATYALSGRSLELELLVENPDSQNLPCGLGVHPYFRLPLGGGSSESCLVKLPGTERWELKEMLPTGRRLPLDDEQWQGERSFGQLQLDDVFTGLPFENSLCQASIRDPGGATLLQQFDDAFRECVVYTPPHRQAICIEPYTCVPGAFQLQAEGVDAGLRVLAPGESFRTRMRMEVP